MNLSNTVCRIDMSAGCAPYSLKSVSKYGCVGVGKPGLAHSSAALKDLGHSSGHGNCAGNQHWKITQLLLLPSMHDHFLPRGYKYIQSK